MPELAPLAVDLALARGREYHVNFKTGCWEWVGNINRDGYGQIGKAKTGGVTHLAHRWHFYKKHGELPRVLDHLCRVRHCCNPDHLEATTRAENVRRGERAKLNWDVVAEIRRLPATERNIDIAAKYGMSTGAISLLRRNLIWPEKERPVGLDSNTNRGPRSRV